MGSAVGRALTGVLVLAACGLASACDGGDAGPARAVPGARSDVNGDGLDDFVMQTYRGQDVLAVVVFGSRERRPVDLRQAGLTITLTGSAEVAPENPRLIGDVDGDGFGDVALTTGLGDQGYIVYGRDTAGAVRIDVRRPAPAGITEVAGLSGNGDQLGAIEPAGDVDGDGRSDVLLPGPKGRRLATVLRGGPRTPLVRALRPSARLLPVRGTRGWQNLAVGIGDHGGDARHDLAVATLQRGRSVAIGAWVAFGLPGVRGYRLSTDGRARTVRAGSRRAGYYVPACGKGRRAVGRCPADPDSIGASFGLSPPVPVGDIDGNGFDDLAVNRLDRRRRSVTRIVLGRRAIRREGSGRTLPAITWRGLGDVDGDGVPDVLGIRRGERRVAVLHLTRDGRIKATTRIRGKGVYDFAPAGDRDGDGFADLVAFGDEATMVVYGAPEHGVVDVGRDSGRVVEISGAG